MSQEMKPNGKNRVAQTQTAVSSKPTREATDKDQVKERDLHLDREFFGRNGDDEYHKTHLEFGKIIREYLKDKLTREEAIKKLQPILKGSNLSKHFDELLRVHDEYLTSHKSSTYEALSAAEQADALDAFAIALLPYLRGKANDDNVAEVARRDAVSQDESLHRREDVVRRVGLTLGYHIDSRQFEPMLRGLYKERLLTISPRRLNDLAKRIEDVSSVKATVVAGCSEKIFAKVAAQEFIRQIQRIGRQKKTSKPGNKELHVCVGVMSGTTCRAVIQEACEMNWRDEGVDPGDLPKIIVLALNVSHTTPAHISGNATVLAYQLANKINRELAKDSKEIVPEIAAEAYGLSATPFVMRAQLPEIDCSEQTREVLKYTQPSRIKGGPGAGTPAAKDEQGTAAGGQASQTELDVVLSSIGGKPGAGSGSLLFDLMKYKYGEVAKQKMQKAMEEQNIRGDLAFTALTYNGNSARICDDKNEEICCYSAIDLPVLEAMAADPNKAVILVSRHETGKDKMPAIAVVIGSKWGGTETRRYASHLVLDEASAENLLMLLRR